MSDERGAAGWSFEKIRAEIPLAVPAFAQLGIEVVYADKERCRVAMPITPAVSRPGAMASGPALFTMADTAAYGLALALNGEPMTTTANMTLSFLRPAQGATAVAEARALKIGRRLFNFEVRLWCEPGGEGRLVAHAVTAYAPPQPNP